MIELKVIHPKYTYSDTITIGEESSVYDQLAQIRPITILKWVDNLKTALSYARPGLQFEAYYPDEIIDPTDDYRMDDIITWRVRSALPSAKGRPATDSYGTGTRDTKGFELFEYDDPKNGKAYSVYKREMDYFIIFDIWSNVAQRAEELTHWFRRDFMTTLGDTFGTPYVYFRERQNDENEEKKLKTKLKRRSLTYMVKLTELDAIETTLIESIKAEITTKE